MCRITSQNNKKMLNCVKLRRKSLNETTSCYEWKSCICKIDSNYILHIRSLEVTEDKSNLYIKINLSWQLERIYHTGNSTNRFRMEYYQADSELLDSSKSERKLILSEEFIAPSKAICQEWILCIQKSIMEAKHDVNFDARVTTPNHDSEIEDQENKELENKILARSNLHRKNSDCSILSSNITNQEDVQATSREELEMLIRVEAAFHDYEKEKHIFMTREQKLIQKLQTLQDDVRILRAEKMYFTQQHEIFHNEKLQFDLERSHLETMIQNLQDTLKITQDENKLLAFENHRLIEEKKELSKHVHRLDALVYGRF